MTTKTNLGGPYIVNPEAEGNFGGPYVEKSKTELTQLSMEWRQLRAGNITASKAADVLTENKSKSKRPYYSWAPWWLSRVAGRYMLQLIDERVSGAFADRAASHQMQYGRLHEDEARERTKHELLRIHGDELQLPVGELAYIVHPKCSEIGCSPDFAVGADTLGEIKNPWDGSRHAEAILTRDFLELEHRPQVQFSLWVSGRQNYKIVSYDHRWRCQQLHIVDAERDEMFIESELAPSVLRFHGLLLDLMDRHFPHVGQEAPF